MTERNVLRVLAESACVEKTDLDVVDPERYGNGSAREEDLGPVLDIEVRLERHADEDGFAIDPYRASVSSHIIGDPGHVPATKEGLRSLNLPYGMIEKQVLRALQTVGGEGDLGDNFRIGTVLLFTS